MKSALSLVVSWSSALIFVLSNCSLMTSSSNHPYLNLPSVSGWDPKWYRHPQKWQMSSLKGILSPTSGAGYCLPMVPMRTTTCLFSFPHGGPFLPCEIGHSSRKKELVSGLFYCNRCMKGLKEKTSQSKPMWNRETGGNIMEERRVFTLGTSQERQTVHIQTLHNVPYS